jgi:hypothetical protein
MDRFWNHLGGLPGKFESNIYFKKLSITKTFKAALKYQGLFLSEGFFPPRLHHGIY